MSKPPNNNQQRLPKPWIPKVITIPNTNRQVHFQVPPVPYQARPIPRPLPQRRIDIQAQQYLNQLYGVRPSQPRSRPPSASTKPYWKRK